MSTTSHRGGEGEPLVLIHGFSGTRALWQPVLEPLEARHDVLAVTLAGHVGGPEIAPEQVSLPALVDAVERDMDEAGFDSAHLVGNSLGGWIALELARRGRARSVVGISPAGGWVAGTPDERRLRNLFRRNHRFGSALGSRAEKLLRRPRLRHLLLRDAVAHGELIPPAAAAAMLRDSVACPIYFPLMDAILRDGPPQSFSGISCPVLLAWGTGDRILPTPRYSRRLREMIPAAEWLEFAGLGHMPMSDDRELVARTIVDFAAKAGTPAAAPAAA
jgi:pimeloyl-ACP methyl ester carboxylesterase